MKITASIVMYSGLQDPEMDVSPEIATDIIIKLNIADTAFGGKVIMGFHILELGLMAE